MFYGLNNTPRTWRKTYDGNSSCLGNWFKLNRHRFGGRFASNRYSEKVPVEDLVAKGYRWITVDGPYAGATEEEARKIASNRTDFVELQMVEEGRAYHLIPGMLVRVTHDDSANGMSEILLGGITRPLWTYNKFLADRPIRDIYGIVETPDTAGLIDPSDAAVMGAALNERARGGRP